MKINTYIFLAISFWLLHPLALNSSVLSKNVLFSKTFKIQDRYYNQDNNSNHVLGFNHKNGDVLLEVDFAKSFIKVASGAIRGIGAYEYKLLQKSLNDKTGNPKVKHLLKLKKDHYKHNGHLDRYLEFNFNPKHIKLPSKMLNALRHSDKINIVLEKRSSSKGYDYFALILKADKVSPVMLLPWKI